MGCITDDELFGIEINCEAIPTGGIKSVYIAAVCDTALGFVDKISKPDGTPMYDYGAVVSLAFRDVDEATPSGIGKVYKLDFNSRDATTAFTEAKTVEDSGAATVLQTLTFQMPKNNVEKRNLANKLINPYAKFYLFLEMNNTTVASDGSKRPAWVILGAKFGVRAKSTGNGSGASKTDFNGYNLVFEAEETELAYYVAHPDLQNGIEIKQVPLAGDAHFDIDTAKTTYGEAMHVPFEDCIPSVPVP